MRFSFSSLCLTCILVYLDCEAPKSLHHISHFRRGTSNARKTDPIKHLSKSNITQQLTCEIRLTKEKKKIRFKKVANALLTDSYAHLNITEIIFLSQQCVQDAIAKFRLAVHCACRNPPRQGALFSSVEGPLRLFISSLNKGLVNSLLLFGIPPNTQ